jgi:hypothetical protein
MRRRLAASEDARAELAKVTPNVTRRAAKAYGFDFRYESRPNWDTHPGLHPGPRK